MKVLTFVLLLFPIVIGGFTAKHFPELDGLKIASPIKLKPNAKPPNYYDISTNGVESFDVSEKWPNCKDVFEDVQVQGNCSSSWAIAVATSIRDRRCIKSGVKEPISAYDLVSCCQDCQLDGQNGCNGGDHDSAFLYFSNDGIVTGGAYHSHIGCKPYPIKPDRNFDSPKVTRCVKSCDSSYKTNTYENDKIKGNGQIPFAYKNQQVMDEIMQNGPVVAEFRLYEDFLNYSGGVYQYRTGKLLGSYYAKIIAWGVDKSSGLSFWCAVASFGSSNWGENGTFRIKRGVDECGFESNIVAGIVETVKDTLTADKVEPTLAELDCNSITAYYSGAFQDKLYSSHLFYEQFQIGATINPDPYIRFNFKNYSTSYASGYYYYIQNETSSVQCNTGQSDECRINYDDLSQFLVYFGPYNTRYNFDLIYINPLMDNKFTLENAVGKCAKTLKGNAPNDTDPSLYQSCFCCGDKYNPNPSLGCPLSPWA